MPDPTPPQAPSERCGSCETAFVHCTCGYTVENAEDNTGQALIRPAPPSTDNPREAEQAGKSEERWTITLCESPNGTAYQCTCEPRGYVDESGELSTDYSCRAEREVEVVPLALLTQAESQIKELRGERDARQNAIDKALSAVEGTAYVGGPSQAEAYSTIVETLGPFRTEHISQGSPSPTRGDG